MASQVYTESAPSGLSERALDDLRSSFAGALIRPGDESYAAARKVWNGAIDRRPALIARCTGTADVMVALAFAHRQELLVAVRGGGHNVAGTAVCDGGLVIDLSVMKGIRVDPLGRSAWAQPGVLWDQLDRETQAFGLATTGGIVTHTGIAGLTLGGGIGWLMRKHGLTIDNLIGVDLVTADGAFLHASETENQDLFWGVRGGGGNFGIVTAFQYRLHPLGPAVLAGTRFYPMGQAREVLAFCRDYLADAPDELTAILGLRLAPPLPSLPADLHGTPVLAVNVCYAGAVEAGERVLQPLRQFGSPLADLIVPKPYLAHQAMFDANVPHGWHYYWKSLNLADLADQAIERLVSHSSALTSPRSFCLLFRLGGAVGRVPEGATAYNNRSARYIVNINAAWTENEGPPEQHTRWAQTFWSALQPYAGSGAYVNFLDNEGEDRVRAAYGAPIYERLVELKTRYDPDNVFRLNQNIKPRTERQRL